MGFTVRSLKFNFVMNLILTASGMLFPLITFPIVSRALLADAYGVCGFASGVVSWLSLIALLGANRYGIREVAAARDNPARLCKVTREIFTVTLISTTVVYLCFIASLFLVERLAMSRTLLLVNSATIICNTLGVNWFFQGIEQYRYITIRGLVIKVVCLIGVVALVHVPSDYLVYAALLVCTNGLANLVNFGYGCKILRDARREAQVQGTALGRLNLRQHVRPLLTFFTVVAAISVYTALDTVMLGFLSTDAQVGYYTAAAQVKQALAAVCSALAGVLLPRAANLLANGRRDEHRQVIRRCLRLVLAVSLPLCLVLAALATPLITWYGGVSFAGAGPALSVVSVAVIFISLSSIFCDAVMIPLGMERCCSWIYLGAAVVDFFGNLFLIPAYGALGAAYATAFVEAAIAIIEFCIVFRYLWPKC